MDGSHRLPASRIALSNDSAATQTQADACKTDTVSGIEPFLPLFHLTLGSERVVLIGFQAISSASQMVARRKLGHTKFMAPGKPAVWGLGRVEKSLATHNWEDDEVDIGPWTIFPESFIGRSCPLAPLARSALTRQSSTAPCAPSRNLRI